MQDQVEQIKNLGFSALAIGIGEDVEEDEKNVKEANVKLCSVVQRPGSLNLGKRAQRWKAWTADSSACIG